MKEEKSFNNIKIAFVLNMLFSIIELIGGFLTNSISIISDAIHDFGDAVSIAIAMLLEKKSNNKPDEVFTFGYLRFSILGALITATILLIGSILVIYNAIPRLINPELVNYNGMIILAVIGVIVNLAATKVTSHSDNVNEKVVSLHMLEDVLGWAAVLLGSIIMQLFGWYIIDSLLSIAITLFILVNVVKNYKTIFNIFLEKMPDNIKIEELKKHLSNVEKVEDIHHVHVWTMDGMNNYATLHVLVDGNIIVDELEKIKEDLREELEEHNINHSVIEFESKKCEDPNCTVDKLSSDNHFGHHH